MIKELTIKTFMPDSRRPTWLIELIFRVRMYFPFKHADTWELEKALDWIRGQLDETTFRKRTAIYKVSQCTRNEIVGNKLTVYTLYKDNPMVEFEIITD